MSTRSEISRIFAQLVIKVGLRKVLVITMATIHSVDATLLDDMHKRM